MPLMLIPVPVQCLKDIFQRTVKEFRRNDIPLSDTFLDRDWIRVFPQLDGHRG